MVFKYSRKKVVNKKDSEGKLIPVLQPVIENGITVRMDPVPGKFETEELWRTDYINLGKMIRTHEMDDGSVIVLLDDGHDETQKVPVSLKNPKKGPVEGNIVSEKQTHWVQSEILIQKPEDVQRLYNSLDKLASLI